MIGLTEAQARLVAFLRQRQAQGDVMPSIREMKEHLGAASTAGVVRLLNALEERGHIRRIPNRSRAIAVVDDNPLAQFSSAELQAELDRRARAA